MLPLPIRVRCTCGARFDDGIRYCPECGRPRSYVQREIEQLAAVAGESKEVIEEQDRAGVLAVALPREVRLRRLDRVVAEMSARDYEIVSRLDVSVQMRKRKQFSLLLAFVLLIVTAGVGLLFYLLYLVAVPGDLVYLRIDDRGTASITGNVPFKIRDLIRELNETTG